MASPTDRRYSEEHVWVKKEGNYVSLGLTQHNIDTFGQVYSVSNLLGSDKEVIRGNSMGTLNRANDSDDFIAPVNGNVADRDEHLFDIGGVNTDPYAAGSWFLKVDGVTQADFDALMSASKYDEFTQ